MRNSILFLPILGTLAALGTAPALAQRHELGLSLGAFKPTSRTLAVTPPSKADFSAGLTFYANYGIRLAGGDGAALYFELPFVASPQHTVASSNGAATRDVATLYITPGFKLKIAPGAPISPWIAAGAGYALFEHSTERLDGAANQAPRHVNRGAVNFGAGVDLKLLRRISLRGEFRDFISGNPSFNLPVSGSLQHNLLFAGGFVLRF
jgi:opacity protein-like surface antigen